VTRCRRIPKAPAGGLWWARAAPRTSACDRGPVPAPANEIRARTRRALRCCVVATANGAPATVTSTVPALPDRGRQQPGRFGRPPTHSSYTTTRDVTHAPARRARTRAHPLSKALITPAARSTTRGRRGHPPKTQGFARRGCWSTNTRHPGELRRDFQGKARILTTSYAVGWRPRAGARARPTRSRLCSG
jgi:hypothetical protein